MATDCTDAEGSESKMSGSDLWCLISPQCKISCTSQHFSWNLFFLHHVMFTSLFKSHAVLKHFCLMPGLPLRTSWFQDLKAVHRLAFSDRLPAHQQCLQVLRGKTEFCRYVAGVAAQKVQQVMERGWCDGPQGHNSEKLFTHCARIAKYVL